MSHPLTGLKPLQSRASQLLKELESLYSTQLIRIRSRSLVEGQPLTSLDASADPAPHASGRRKPSLDETEEMLTGRLVRWRHPTRRKS